MNPMAAPVPSPVTPVEQASAAVPNVPGVTCSPHQCWPLGDSCVQHTGFAAQSPDVGQSAVEEHGMPSGGGLPNVVYGFRIETVVDESSSVPSIDYTES